MSTIIAAVAQNGVIGTEKGLPWYVPNEFKLFKRLTLGKALIMGGVSWRQIGASLPGRDCYAITRDQGAWAIDGIRPISLSHAYAMSIIDGAPMSASRKVYVGGGESIFEHFIYNKFVDEFIISWMKFDADGKYTFPMTRAELVCKYGPGEILCEDKQFQTRRYI
jgi:dihydrofolate reductase